MVVDTDDGELAGYAHAGLTHPVEQPHRDLVRRGDDGRPQVRAPQQGGRRSEPVIDAELGRTTSVMPAWLTLHAPGQQAADEVPLHGDEHEDGYDHRDERPG